MDDNQEILGVWLGNEYEDVAGETKNFVDPVETILAVDDFHFDYSAFQAADGVVPAQQFSPSPSDAESEISFNFLSSPSEMLPFVFTSSLITPESNNSNIGSTAAAADEHDEDAYHSDSSSSFSERSSPSSSPSYGKGRSTEKPTPAAKRARVTSHPAPTTQMAAKLNKALHLDLQEEELVNLDLESIQQMAGMQLTKTEERDLKKLRRKLKNKMSAAQSRQKKRDYVEGLEERMNIIAKQNAELRERLKISESKVQTLEASLAQYQSVEEAVRKAHLSGVQLHPFGSANATTAATTAFAAEDPLLNKPSSKRPRLTTTQTVSCFMVVFLLFSALINPRMVSDPAGFVSSLSSSFSLSEILDDAAHLDASGRYGSPSSHFQPGVFTGRKLLTEPESSSSSIIIDSPSAAALLANKLNELEQEYPAAWKAVAGVAQPLMTALMDLIVANVTSDTEIKSVVDPLSLPQIKQETPL